VAIIEDQKII